jgi:hypothetical protein
MSLMMRVAAHHVRAAGMLVVRSHRLVEADRRKGPVSDCPDHVEFIQQMYGLAWRAIGIVGKMKD